MFSFFKRKKPETPVPADRDEDRVSEAPQQPSDSPASAPQPVEPERTDAAATDTVVDAPAPPDVVTQPAPADAATWEAASLEPAVHEVAPEPEPELEPEPEPEPEAEPAPQPEPQPEPEREPEPAAAAPAPRS